MGGNNLTGGFRCTLSDYLRFITDELRGIQHRSKKHDYRAVLIIPKHRNPQVLQSIFDFKTARRTDVIEIHASKDGSNPPLCADPALPTELLVDDNGSLTEIIHIVVSVDPIRRAPPVSTIELLPGFR
jgi:hypothetical protein